MAWRTGYLYTDNYAGLNVANAPYSDYTHIIISYISLNSDGSIDTSQLNLGDVATIVSLAHSAGAKVMMGIGDLPGNGSTWNAATSSGTRATLVSNLVSFASAHGLDGYDLDWEQNINDSQYGAFMQALRAGLGSGATIVVAAYGGSSNSPLAALTSGGGQSAVDQVNMMTYDMAVYEPRSWYNTAIHPGPNGEASIQARIDEFTGAGIPVSKLGVGIPFYGWRFPGDTGPLQAQDHTGGIPYANINTSGNVYDSTYGGQGVVTGGEWITYAGPELIGPIVTYGNSRGVGGYMTFPINWEDSGHTLSAALASGTGSSTPTVPTIYTFSANPTTVTSAADAVLSWSVSGATSLSIDNGIGTVTGTSHTVNPTATTTYTLTATNTQGSVTKTVTVVIGSGAPSIQSFTASPANFVPGASVTLSWATLLASSLSIDNGVGTVTGTSTVVTPGATTTYTLTAANGSGSVTATVTVTAGSSTAAGAPALPVIQSFSASSTAVTQGTPVTLSLSVLGAGARGISITPDIGVVIGNSISVTPLTTTTFTLLARNGAGAVSKSIQIVVHGSVGENIRVHQIRRAERHGDYQILQASDGTGVVRHLAGFNLDGSLTDSGIDAADVSKSSAQPYHIVFYQPGPLAANDGAGNAEPCMQWTCPSDLVNGVAFANAFGGFAKGYLQANPTSTATCNVYKVSAGSSAGILGTAIGSIVIATTGAFAFSLSASSFAPGDSMTVWPPNPTDSTLAGIGWTLPGVRGAFAGSGVGTGGTGGTTGGTGTTIPPDILIDGVGVSFDDVITFDAPDSSVTFS